MPTTLTGGKIALSAHSDVHFYLELSIVRSISWSLVWQSMRQIPDERLSRVAPGRKTPIVFNQFDLMLSNTCFNFKQFLETSLGKIPINKLQLNQVFLH